MGWENLKPKWMKVWRAWFFSPSHRGFGADEHAVGLYCMDCANAYGRRSNGDGWVLTTLGDAVTVAAIARDLNMTTEEVESALRMLVGVGTMTRTENGTLCFPKLRQFQEDRSTTHRKRSIPDVEMQHATQHATQHAMQHAMQHQKLEARGSEDQKREDQKSEEQKKSPPAPDARSGSAGVLEFPCTGKGQKTWVLTEEYLASLQTDYETIDVLFELKKLRQRVLADPLERKTHRGYPRRVVNWLNRAVDWRGKRAEPATRQVKTAAEQNMERILDVVGECGQREMGFDLETEPIETGVLRLPRRTESYTRGLA